MRYIVLFCFLIIGCLGANTTRKLTKKVKQGFTNKLEGRSTGLARNLDIGGYYRYWHKSGDGRYVNAANSKDTFFVDIIFFDDGTFLYNPLISQEFKNYNSFFTSLSEAGKSSMFYKNNSWGIYKVVADTIKTQVLMHASNFTPWWGGERCYLIKDRKTIQIVFSGGLINETERSRQLGSEYVRNASLATFHPLEVIPLPYAWFKENKFFWRKESDWKKYVNEN